MATTFDHANSDTQLTMFLLTPEPNEVAWDTPSRYQTINSPTNTSFSTFEKNAAYCDVISVDSGTRMQNCHW